LSWRPPLTKLCAGAGAGAGAVVPSFCMHICLAVILGYHGCMRRRGSQLRQAGERVRAEWFPAHRTRAAECSPVVFVCPILVVVRGCMHPSNSSTGVMGSHCASHHHAVQQPCSNNGSSNRRPAVPVRLRGHFCAALCYKLSVRKCRNVPIGVNGIWQSCLIHLGVLT
jgi:hypothetical protein